MKIFRNPEVKKSLLMYVIVAASATFISFMAEIRFGFFMLFVCLSFVSIHLVTTYKRYKRIFNMAADIDKILHGDLQTSIGNYSEGELAILQSEVYKMTVCLREQQNKLKEDKVFLADSLADISHQIRTPLTSINLLVSLITEPGITDERKYKLSCELYELLSRIEWLITSLLKISKLDAGTVLLKKEKIPLSELINKSTSPLLIPMDLRNQTLKITAKDDFFGDVLWTSEAITNIVKNCMEHTPEGGIINIEACDNPLYTQIIISDNGSGILAEDIPHIFERFYKGKNSDDKSFGIGLALARMIITVQNGTVKAENRMPNGAKFTVRFYKGTV